MALAEVPLEVFAWGKGEDGRCGHGCEASQLVPRSVLFCSSAAGAISIVEIGAGSDHTLARGSDGHVYAFGLGGQGEESKEIFRTPWHHTLRLTRYAVRDAGTPNY